jgi:hypothetical protein
MRLGPPPRRLLAALGRRLSTVGLPRWGKDAHPPLFFLGLALPEPRGLTGAPEPPAVAARPLRPIWPSPNPLDLFPVPPSLFPCQPYPESRPEVPNCVSSGELQSPSAATNAAVAGAWPESPQPPDPNLTVWIRSRPVPNPSRPISNRRTGLDPDRHRISTAQFRSGGPRKSQP